MTKTYTAKKGYLLYMLEKGNLLREDDTSDHNRLVRVLVIAVLIGEHLDRDEGDERLVCHEKSCTILEKNDINSDWLICGKKGKTLKVHKTVLQ